MKELQSSCTIVQLGVDPVTYQKWSEASRAFQEDVTDIQKTKDIIRERQLIMGQIGRAHV